ncbi:hypothetical protein ACIQ00_10985 [Micrococcus luteus]|uniref:hypothetical protein n=1 Tax=Micrococcus luteus TaxID=1270 RepID=UPI0034246363
MQTPSVERPAARAYDRFTKLRTLFEWTAAIALPALAFVFITQLIWDGVARRTGGTPEMLSSTFWVGTIAPALFLLTLVGMLVARIQWIRAESQPEH